MRKLGEQWIEEIDGKRHMLKAVKQTNKCSGCVFCTSYWCGDHIQSEREFDCSNMIIKDLGILNEEGLLPCPFCVEYPKIGNFGDGFSDTTFYVKHNQSECVICGLMRTKSFKTRQQAIDAWNRRT
jgi:hypothetical protein